MPLTQYILLSEGLTMINTGKEYFKIMSIFCLSSDIRVTVYGTQYSLIFVFFNLTPTFLKLPVNVMCLNILV